MFLSLHCTWIWIEIRSSWIQFHKNANTENIWNANWFRNDPVMCMQKKCYFTRVPRKNCYPWKTEIGTKFYDRVARFMYHIFRILWPTNFWMRNFRFVDKLNLNKNLYFGIVRNIRFFWYWYIFDIDIE